MSSTTDGTDPSILRRKVGIALRRKREDNDITQRDAAARLEWSLSKLIRIEQGLQGISVADMRTALAVYRVTDPGVVAELTAAARGTRGQSWWNGYKDLITPAFGVLLGYEGDAASLRASHGSVLPGLLHTREYAAALESPYGRESAARMIDLRMRRQERIYAEPAIELSFAVTEAAVRCRVGGPTVMRRQLERLVEVSRRPNVTTWVIPLAAGAHPGQQGPFVMLRLRDPDEDLVFLEGLEEDQIIRDHPGQIAEYDQYFGTLAKLALPPDDGLALVEDEIGRLREAEKGGRAAS